MSRKEWLQEVNTAMLDLDNHTMRRLLKNTEFTCNPRIMNHVFKAFYDVGKSKGYYPDDSVAKHAWLDDRENMQRIRKDLMEMLDILGEHGYKGHIDGLASIVYEKEYTIARHFLRYISHDDVECPHCVDVLFICFEDINSEMDIEKKHEVKRFCMDLIASFFECCPLTKRLESYCKNVYHNRKFAAFVKDLYERERHYRRRREHIEVLHHLGEENPYFRQPWMVQDIVSYIDNSSGGGGKKPKTRTNSRNRGICPRTTRRRRASRCGKRSS